MVRIIARPPAGRGQLCKRLPLHEPLRLQRAVTFLARLRGLHGRPRLQGRQGIWLHPCRAVHTFGLPYHIDIVFLDKGLNVLETRHGVPPWRAVFCLQARSVVELPAGYCARNLHFSSAIRRALVE